MRPAKSKIRKRAPKRRPARGSSKGSLSFSEYKRSLELATEGMVEILDIEKLIRLIVYMIVKKVKLVHAGILLYDETKKFYVLSTSRGRKGSVIPREYIRIEADDVLIKFFKSRKNYSINKSGVIRLDDLNNLLKRKEIGSKEKNFKLSIIKIRDEMINYDVDALVPGYFQKDNLLGVLFLGRKANRNKFHQDELDFFMALARTAVMAIRNAQLYKNIQKIFFGVIQAMALSIEKFDPDFIRPHMDRMFKMAARLVEKLDKRGVVLPDMPRELFLSSIFLHDIGKQYTPKEILYKEGRLTDEDWVILKKHPVDGAEIFEQIDGLQEVAAIIRYHQERYDGTGYPEGLKGDKIPVGARIASVLDTFDAMTNARPYRKIPFTIKDAVKELIKAKSTQLDPNLVDAFIEVLLEEGILLDVELKEICSDSSIERLFNNLVYR